MGSFVPSASVSFRSADDHRGRQACQSEARAPQAVGPGRGQAGKVGAQQPAFHMTLGLAIVSSACSATCGMAYPSSEKIPSKCIIMSARGCDGFHQKAWKQQRCHGPRQTAVW